jgi:ParB-like chromosome segregation protein Spo0J
VPIRDLNFYYKNARRGDVEKVAESLDANKQYKPIVVNRGTITGRPNEILAGNHTVKGAKKLSWRHVDVMWVDLDEEQARRIVLADNGTTDDAGYDTALLAELLETQRNEVGNLIGTTYADEVLGKLMVEMNRDPLESIDSIEDAPDDLPGVEDLSRYVFFDSDANFDIPELRLDRRRCSRPR